MHWNHRETTNPIESTVATVRLRSQRPHLVALARAGATFKKGVLVEQPPRPSTPTRRSRRVINSGRAITILDDSSTGTAPACDHHLLTCPGLVQFAMPWERR